VCDDAYGEQRDADQQPRNGIERPIPLDPCHEKAQESGTAHDAEHRLTDPVRTGHEGRCGYDRQQRKRANEGHDAERSARADNRPDPEPGASNEVFAAGTD